MVRTKRFRDTSRSGPSRSASTSTQHALDDPVAPEAPQQSESVPSTQPEAGSDTVQESLPHDCHSTSTDERKIYWMVDVIDEQGVKKKQKLRLHDVWRLPPGHKVVLPFDRFRCPTTDAAALYAQVLGDCARDTVTFPINYEDWRKVPLTWKNEQFNNTILPKFHFENVDLQRAMDYTRKNIGRKRHDFKLDLWNEFYDPLLSREAMQNKVPPGIQREQWASYVNYRFEEKTKEMCKKNKENRKKQKVPHTGGSKSLPRRRNEMETERGRPLDRGELYIVTHKRKDGSYVNEQAKTISEQIKQEMSQNLSAQTNIVSQDDALGKVLGKEHPGRVRGMGFGPTPSSVFGMPAGGYGNMSSSSASASSSSNPQMQERMKSLESELESERQIRRLMESNLEAERERRNALEAALASAFEEILGRVPQQFANLLSHPSAAIDEGSGDQATPSVPRRSSSASHEPEHN